MITPAKCQVVPFQFAAQGIEHGREFRFTPNDISHRSCIVFFGIFNLVHVQSHSHDTGFQPCSAKCVLDQNTRDLLTIHQNVVRPFDPDRLIIPYQMAHRIRNRKGGNSTQQKLVLRCQKDRAQNIRARQVQIRCTYPRILPLTAPPGLFICHYNSTFQRQFVLNKLAGIVVGRIHTCKLDPGAADEQSGGRVSHGIMVTLQM